MLTRRHCEVANVLEHSRRKLNEQGRDAVIGLDDAMRSHVIACIDRRLFKTDRGYIGVAPKASKTGDHVFILGGAPSPVVLRDIGEFEDEGHRVVVTLGHCYVDGIMDGQALSMHLPRQHLLIK